MVKSFRKRRLSAIFILVTLLFSALINNPDLDPSTHRAPEDSTLSQNLSTSKSDLESLEVKGRAPKTGYSRKRFGDGWQKDESGCDTRNRILKRDLVDTVENSKCQIVTGKLNDPYTGKIIEFNRNTDAAAVQIDHVVALSDAWQKGAQSLSFEKRVDLANDPLNLLASEGAANQEKGDADAATWIPPNKPFRCEYAQRQIAVKKKYSLWVTNAEKRALSRLLETCA